ncbi:BnaA04g28610D [Brassica napus]|uniref:BnaA04g28610D protein n=1 Tax=Brassica napus TaxID=3708 RepID=A0A078IN63_BRANA|nr:BnaA04g28610D [Brassica napus]
MGEYKIEDFSKPITPVEGAKTGVFWNIDDCPFPVTCQCGLMLMRRKGIGRGRVSFCVRRRGNPKSISFQEGINS